MSENKRLLARYDSAIQNYAKLLIGAIEAGDTSKVGYDLIEASVTVDQRREMVLPFAEAWMLEYIAVSTNFIRALVSLANDRSGNPALSTAVRSALSAYEAARQRFFSPEDLENA
ncbi:hypothetical protein D3C71_174650 [compost metagenome]